MRIPPASARSGWLVVLACLLLVGCERESGDRGATPPARPSILLVVVDTLRADAVSAYGAVTGTTPHLDALAERGLRYTRAYAPAPWTIPSHVTLFSGLAAERHGIGISGRVVAGDDLEMVAERLAARGYETAAFIENSFVSEPFGMAQGFETFAARTLAQTLQEFREPGSSGYVLQQAFADWLRGRARDRPFFAFVNIFDAHEPYERREDNPFLPAGTTKEQVTQTPRTTDPICDAIPSGEALEIVRAFYLADVATADAKLGEIHRFAAEQAEGSLITVVTADHGEHLGERRLLGHQYTMHGAAIHVPLVVDGVPDVPPAVIEQPVTLADVPASILEWAGADGGAALDGRPLPVDASAEGDAREIVSLETERLPSDWPLPGGVPGKDADTKRARCGSGDRVFGDRAALIRYPYKLVWSARYPLELYDLRSDPGERDDLADRQPELARQMAESLHARVAPATASSDSPPISDEAQKALRALGYAE